MRKLTLGQMEAVLEAVRYRLSTPSPPIRDRTVLESAEFKLSEGITLKRRAMRPSGREEQSHGSKSLA